MSSSLLLETKTGQTVLRCKTTAQRLHCIVYRSPVDVSPISSERSRTFRRNIFNKDWWIRRSSDQLSKSDTIHLSVIRAKEKAKFILVFSLEGEMSKMSKKLQEAKSLNIFVVTEDFLVDVCSDCPSDVIDKCKISTWGIMPHLRKQMKIDEGKVEPNRSSRSSSSSEYRNEKILMVNMDRIPCLRSIETICAGQGTTQVEGRSCGRSRFRFDHFLTINARRSIEEKFQDSKIVVTYSKISRMVESILPFLV